MNRTPKKGSPALTQLLYVSTAVSPFDAPALAELLRKARDHNERAGVTGLLLYKAPNFMQVLEGPEASVDRLFSTIERDPRHARVLTLLRQPAERRDFPDWSMAFNDLGDASVHALPGYSEFLNVNFTDPAFIADPSRAKRVVDLFLGAMR